MFNAMCHFSVIICKNFSDNYYPRTIFLILIPCILFIYIYI